MKQTTTELGARLDEAEIAAIRRVVDRIGSINRASRALGLSRPALERAAGGLPIRAGTAMLVRHALAAVSSSLTRSGAQS